MKWQPLAILFWFGWSSFYKSERGQPIFPFTNVDWVSIGLMAALVPFALGFLRWREYITLRNWDARQRNNGDG